MPTTLSFKDVIDKPQWRPVASSHTASPSIGPIFFGDHRNSEDRYPKLIEMPTAVTQNFYNIKNGGWTQATTPLTGSWGSGANAVFMPHRGPRGTLTGTPTSTHFVLSTLESIGGIALTAGLGQFANRGDGIGFKIRIIDTATGVTGES
jgi:hypothetical protein